MCTVTYIPQSKDSFVLTSNRDEAIGRTTIPPSFYEVGGVKMLFPKDGVAGGTWIGISGQQRLICLLNGGFTNHLRVDNYRHSRGIVVKDLLKAKSLEQHLEAIDLKQIEPFTVIAIDWSDTPAAKELVWDGQKAHIDDLGNTARIWSSSTLYTQEMKDQRQRWFAQFLEKHTPTAAEILEFHQTAGIGDPNIDLNMDRGHLKTVSTTQVVKTASQCTMTYHDYGRDNKYSAIFEFETIDL